MDKFGVQLASFFKFRITVQWLSYLILQEEEAGRRENFFFYFHNFFMFSSDKLFEA